MSLLSLGSLFAFAANLFIGVFVFMHRPERRLHQVFLCLAATLGAWCLGVYLVGAPIARDEGVRWVNFLIIAAVLAAPLVLHLVSLVLADNERPRLPLILGGYFCGTVLALFGVVDVLGVKVDLVPRGDLIWWLSPRSDAALLALPFCAVMFGLSLYRLVSEGRRLRGFARAQARYLSVAVFGLGLAILHDISSGGATYFDTPGLLLGAPIVQYVSTLALCLFAYAILSYRLMELAPVMLKSVVRACALGLLMAPFLYLVYAAGRSGLALPPTHIPLITLAVFAVAVLVVPPLRAARRQLDQAIDTRSSVSRRSLVKLSSEVTKVLDLDELSARVTGGLSTGLGVEWSAIYLRDRASTFVLRRHTGDEHRLPALVETASPLVLILRQLREIVVREEVERSKSIRHGTDIVRQFADFRAELALPLVSGDDLIGFILCGPRSDGSAFSAEDIDALHMVGNLLATAVNNARLCEDLGRSREIVTRSDRLSALGTMAAGLAHEIRNPLVSIRTFTQLLPERIDDSEFRSEFLDLTVSEVDRICALLTEVLAFAKPSSSDQQHVVINSVLERLSLLLASQAKARKVKIATELSSEVTSVMADEDQIKQAFMNLVLNAIQACRAGGQVRVRTMPDTVDRASGVRVEISDDGDGIPSDLLDKVFTPFFTTRPDGTGLGLAIAKEIIDRHLGRISIKSTVGRGTVVTVFLPHLALSTNVDSTADHLLPPTDALGSIARFDAARRVEAGRG